MSRLFEHFGVKYTTGETIFQEGDVADALYMIHKGRVRITRLSPMGDVVMNELGETDFFGEMSLISSAPRNANAVALVDCELIRMDRVSFELTLRDNPNFAMTVVRMLTKRLREADDRMTDLVRDRKRDEVLTSLYHQALSDWKKDPDGGALAEYEKFNERAQHDFQLLNQESINSILKELKNEGYISFKKDDQGRRWIRVQP